MKGTFLNSVFIVFVFILGQHPLFSQGPSKSKPADRRSSTKQETEKIIREYLLKNPEIVREALAALEAKEAGEKLRLEAVTLRSRQNDIFSAPDDPFAGNPVADVSIAIFFDYNCGHCKKTLPAVKKLLSTDPMLRIVYKEFPILGPQSETASLAALAAGRQGKYIEFHSGLMDFDLISDDLIKKLTVSIGLNYEALLKDMKDPKLAAMLSKNYELANALNINGTPAYIVNDQIIPGAIDAASLSKLIEIQRKKNRQAKTPISPAVTAK